MQYLIGAVVGGWTIYSLVRLDAGALAWVATAIVAGAIAALFMLDSRCRACGRWNALQAAEPARDSDPRDAHFQCVHCEHQVVRKTPLARRKRGAA